MKIISIRQLHARTGKWVRETARYERLVVTDRGRAIAQITPASETGKKVSLKDRVLVPGFAALAGKLRPSSARHDSSRYVSEGRR